MTDYNYADERVNLSDNEDSNHAGGLSGHSLDITPRSDWPGTDADPSRVKTDTDSMNDVADQLDSLAERLKSNYVKQLQTKGGSVNYGDQSWHAAHNLQDAMSQLTSLVTEYVTSLQTNLTQASASIRSATGNYSGAEQSNTSSASNQHADL